MADPRWTAADVERYLADAGRPLAPGSMVLEETPLPMRKRIPAAEGSPALWLHDIPTTLPASTTEEALRTWIRKVALPHGWKHYHTWNSQHSPKGFPDDCLARPKSSTSTGRLIFAELKSAKKKPTTEQEIWLDVLRHTIQGLEVYLWRPQDWEDIVDTLTRKETQP